MTADDHRADLYRNLPELRPIARRTIDRLHVREEQFRARLATATPHEHVRLSRELHRTVETREQLAAALADVEADAADARARWGA